jgi:hypothetical protein
MRVLITGAASAAGCAGQAPGFVTVVSEDRRRESIMLQVS